MWLVTSPKSLFLGKLISGMMVSQKLPKTEFCSSENSNAKNDNTNSNNKGQECVSIDVHIPRASTRMAGQFLIIEFDELVLVIITQDGDQCGKWWVVSPDPVIHRVVPPFDCISRPLQHAILVQDLGLGFLILLEILLCVSMSFNEFQWVSVSFRWNDNFLQKFIKWFQFA